MLQRLCVRDDKGYRTSIYVQERLFTYLKLYYTLSYEYHYYMYRTTIQTFYYLRLGGRPAVFRPQPTKSLDAHCKWLGKQKS